MSNTTPLYRLTVAKFVDSQTHNDPLVIDKNVLEYCYFELYEAYFSDARFVMQTLIEMPKPTLVGFLTFLLKDENSAKTYPSLFKFYQDREVDDDLPTLYDCLSSFEEKELLNIAHSSMKQCDYLHTILYMNTKEIIERDLNEYLQKTRL